MANYYAQFVPHFSAIAKPLYRLTQKEVPFEWTEECSQAFGVLKQALTEAPVLRRPDTALPYVLQTDWSTVAIGAVLGQVDAQGEEHPVAYGSRMLRGAETRYSAVEGECLAVVHFVEHYRPYLHGTSFTVEMDHWALQWLMTGEHRNARLERWAMKLMNYDFKVRHRRGAQNANADALSRPPFAPESAGPSMIALAASTRRGSEDSVQCITYAEEGESSGPSVPEELACEKCKSPERAEIMLICSGCITGYHIDCLQPALPAVPKEDWFCSKCKPAAKTASVIDTDSPLLPKETATDTDWSRESESQDITQDTATLPYIKTGGYPEDASETEKARIRTKGTRYAYVEDALYHQKTGKPIPEIPDRKTIVLNAHHLGHFGVTKTTHLVQQRFWWVGLTDMVKQVLKECPECKLMRHTFNEPSVMTPIPVHSTFYKVGIDLVGPLQRTAAGNRYVITCVDYMTKYVEAKALPDKTSRQTADFFYTEIVCRHGTPAEVLSDHGGEFAGAFQDLLDRLHIDHRRSSPYHPQTNGLTERWNQTMTKSLVKMSAQSPDNWDRHLPTVLLGYRATMQASTQYTPFFLLHGREMTLPIQNLVPIPAPSVGYEDPTAQALVDNLQPLQKILTKAKANIETEQERQMVKYAKRHWHGEVKTPEGQTQAVVPCEEKGKGPMFPAAEQLKDVQDQGQGPSQVRSPLKELPTTSVNQTVCKDLQEGDFVAITIHKWYRTAGDKKGKLVPKVEGPFIIEGFTDATHAMAIVADANEVKWKKRTADLSRWDV